MGLHVSTAHSAPAKINACVAPLWFAGNNPGTASSPTPVAT